MAVRTKLYEGKAKILYKGPEPGTLVQYFKDDATAFNNVKKGSIAGKGIINNKITELVMTRLSQIGIPTHFIERTSDREQLIHEVDAIGAIFWQSSRCYCVSGRISTREPRGRAAIGHAVVLDR